MSADYDFEAANAGASLTYPSSANDLRQGGHVLLGDEKPCKITSLTKAKPGKHGHAKVMIVGTDIFTGKKYEGGGPATHNMNVPVIKRKAYQLLMISSDGYLSLFNLDDGSTKDDVNMPEGDLTAKIEKLFRIEKKDVNVVVLSAMGDEIVVDAVEKDRE